MGIGQFTSGTASGPGADLGPAACQNLWVRSAPRGLRNHSKPEGQRRLDLAADPGTTRAEAGGARPQPAGCSPVRRTLGYATGRRKSLAGPGMASANQTPLQPRDRFTAFCRPFRPDAAGGWLLALPFITTSGFGWGRICRGLPCRHREPRREGAGRGRRCFAAITEMFVQEVMKMLAGCR
jgi:hypothetical protein